MKNYTINPHKHLNQKEQNKLLELLSLQGGRDSTLFYFLLKTGARVQEALNLTHADIFLGQDDLPAVLIRGLKGSKDRTIPIGVDLYNSLQRLCEDRDHPFNIKYTRVREIWQKYGIKKKMHSLRHTFAINLYQRTKDVVKTQYALGHRSIDNTMVYVQYLDGIEGLREALA